MDQPCRFPRDRILGCLLGGAIGDALGEPLEGRCGPLQVDLSRGGTVTDDTQLTMATCEAVLELGTVSPEHVARRFLRWFRDGRLSRMGSSTLKALRDLDAGAHWALCGARGAHAAGNGAAMRAAPLAFLLDPDDPVDRQTLRDVARITHHDEEAYVGALAIVVAVRLAAREQMGTEPLCGAVAARLPDSAVKDRLVELAAITASAAVVGARFGTSGYVVDSVPLAIHAARSIEAKGFEAVLQDALAAGGDTDTIGAMTGQIAGARVGRAGLPLCLLDVLRPFGWVVEVAERFASHAAGPGAPR